MELRRLKCRKGAGRQIHVIVSKERYLEEWHSLPVYFIADIVIENIADRKNENETNKTTN